ncbi:uncharacterized protein BDW47DRAFT_93387 [Aspergillus candidus]|uniref:Uncharacterized protein n=1 Tax=Aspergillus candidus TaxID=41067 RepID=A0A2I2FHY7_ASPCN|nr:hypothetical protein BDW47DRAFT_93387 [Aspergillus candidus]PLB40232.1 hypothetical protein BDW47DRAFT_93387 [Aspergillus candidus]
MKFRYPNSPSSFRIRRAESAWCSVLGRQLSSGMCFCFFAFSLWRLECEAGGMDWRDGLRSSSHLRWPGQRGPVAGIWTRPLFQFKLYTFLLYFVSFSLWCLCGVVWFYIPCRSETLLV